MTEETEDKNEEQEKLILAFDAKRLFNNFTGLGNYCRTLLKNLQTYFPQHEYHLFTPKLTKNDETDYFFDNEKFIIHTPKGFRPLWRTFGMASDINQLHPHIFHGLSHELPFGIQHKIKSAVTFHDLIYEIYPLQFGWWDRNMYHWKYKSSAKRSDSIVAISKSTKLDLAKIYQIENDKISVVYQSCGPAFQEMELSNVNKYLPQLNQYFLYVGSIIERKGLLNIVFAYAKLPEEYRRPVVVIGKGDKNYLSKVHDMLHYHGLQHHFHFINGLSNDDLVNMYDRSFALIYPSIYEGFGIPIIESLFRDKPVITSYLSSLPEAAGSGAIIIDPFAPEDIAKAMIQIQEESRYKSLSNDGRKYVENHFSSQQTAEQMMDFYLNLLGRNPLIFQ